MLIENGINNHGDDGCEVRLARNFDEDNHKATGLENRTIFIPMLVIQASYYYIMFPLPLKEAGVRTALTYQPPRTMLR